MHEVDALYLSDVMDLNEYWSRQPPVHVTLAGIVKGIAGTGSSNVERTAPPSIDDLHSLVNQFKR